MMLVRFAAIVLALLVAFATAACDQGTTHPTVYVDSSFTAEEVSPLMYGIDSWERQTDGAVHFNFVFVSHTEAFRMAQDKSKGDALFLVRQSGKENVWCPPEAGVRNGKAGEAHRNNLSGATSICFDADDINSIVSPYFPDLGAWAAWSIVGAHEAGHALRLEHQDTIQSVMHSGAKDVPSYEATCTDVRNVAKEWGFEVPAKCK